MSKPAFPEVFAIRPPDPIRRALRLHAGKFENRNQVITRILSRGLGLDRPRSTAKERMELERLDLMHGAKGGGL